MNLAKALSALRKTVGLAMAHQASATTGSGPRRDARQQQHAHPDANENSG